MNLTDSDQVTATRLEADLTCQKEKRLPVMNCSSCTGQTQMLSFVSAHAHADQPERHGDAARVSPTSLYCNVLLCCVCI